MLSTEQLRDVIGRDAYGSDGEKIGRTDQVFVDDQTGEPEFAALHTGLFGLKTTLVPLAEATFDGDRLQVPYGKDQVKGAPKVEPDAGHLSPDEERTLYEYYGLPTSRLGGTGQGRNEQRGTDQDGTDQRGTDQGDADQRGTDQGDVTPGTDDEAVVVTEEEVWVSTEDELGRVRLRRYVQTDITDVSDPGRRDV